MDLKIVTELIGYTAAAIGAAAFFPQAYRSWKTKNTKAVSLTTFSLLVIVSLLWVLYGFLIVAGPIILVNSIILFLSLFIVFLKIKYR